MAVLIDGKKVSARIRAELAAQAARMRTAGTVPGLAVVIVGEDPASKIYVRNKRKACDETGIYSEIYELPQNASQEELLTLIRRLNDDTNIHGILVQLPLPRHLPEPAVIAAISPEKDVDAFHVANVGRIMLGDYDFLPCTPAGVMALLAYYDIDVSGRECVVVGRSNIVGKPQALLLTHADGTVTICHSKTKNLAEVTRRAEILVVAIGRAGLITGDMVRPGAVVIDVGMNRDADGKLTGDVDFASVEPVASYITPVPGGVGPMTITMLMKNTLTAAERAQNKL